MAQKTLGQVAYEARLNHRTTWGIEAQWLRDDYEKMAAEIVAAHEARRWQAIESAPKFQYVDIWAGGRRIPNAQQCPTRTGVDEWRWWSNGAIILEEATHWTPIPAPPQEVE